MDKIFGLLGEKLGHSQSPAIHAMLGCKDYKLFEVSPDKLAAFMRAREFNGINVTIPYKRSVMPMLSKTSEIARQVGRVNTVIKLPDGKLFGDNTDVYGFNYQLDYTGVDVSGRLCLILGNGGGAAAVKMVLEQRGASKVICLTRTGKDNLGNIGKFSDAEIIVNATPVGMYPENGKTPVSLDGLNKLVAVHDLIYNPLKPRLLLDAEERGVPAYNGLPMLVAQAKRAHELFYNEDVDNDVMPRLIEKIKSMAESVTLIGMPGCGKTAIGAELAKRLGKKHYDLDQIIEKLYGKNPEKIIRREGENAFRRVEHVAAEWAGKHGGTVVSAGGGIVMRADNLYALAQNGKIVFINRNLESLSTEGRPLSQQRPLEDIYAERMPLYRKWCDFEVDNNRTIEETVDQIIEGLNK